MRYWGQKIRKKKKSWEGIYIWGERGGARSRKEERGKRKEERGKRREGLRKNVVF